MYKYKITEDALPFTSRFTSAIAVILYNSYYVFVYVGLRA